ncbi:MAG TPA: DNA-directed RNA polymerase subunit beta', partial [Candidatus Wirthbacteria bacterium]|nr:DNA-directed RNA polymerase subunit beta' [Candidatus Wirthbacteria bacterium]
IVRRERMGHIELATPVAHIWFVRGTPNYLSLLLGITPRKLERVLYYASYIVVSVDEEKKQAALKSIEEQIKEKENELDAILTDKIQELETEYADILNPLSDQIDALAASDDPEANKALGNLESERQQKQTEYTHATKKIRKELKYELKDFTQKMTEKKNKLNAIVYKQILSEFDYYQLAEDFYDVFEAQMGASAVLEIVSQIDLPELLKTLEKKIKTTGSKQKKKKAVKRLRVVEAFIESGNQVDAMILRVLPVIPPDLRPMVQLDGGRFAASDLNDLYRRVINRNNRLKRLLELGAPEVIMRNEKRMLQEAVDALIDNSMHGDKVVSRRNRKLKSLSDILKGKQGRFRQNLLGKRVDYSGRSVIVVGPELALHQCGLPKKMALELFRPFIIRELLARDYVHTVKAASRMIERKQPEVWDVLEEIVQNYPVLLNRAPTLHRLGIQGFFPVLVEGNAIQIHPLVCTAFNADFDGDQMAVHVPLSRLAKEECRNVILSSKNLLLPASGRAAVGPTRDMLLGCYYLTITKEKAKGEGMVFSSPEEAFLALDLDVIKLHSLIKVRMKSGKLIETTVGRLIFNQILPEGFSYQNKVMTKKELGLLIEKCFNEKKTDATALFVDRIKNIGFKYSTQSISTIAVDDVHIPVSKKEILSESEHKAELINEQYQEGLITDNERYEHTVNLWIRTTDKVTDQMMKSMDQSSSLSMMINSGARGNIEQMRQMAGMRGLMADPSGKIIDLPIKSNFKEGLSVLEYFISTHGARKGRADTALRTADSGYLTRRMVDVAQNVIIYQEDCGTEDGLWMDVSHGEDGLNEHFVERAVGRIAAAPIANPDTGEILINRNEQITEDIANQIVKSKVEKVFVRSVLMCRSHFGLCQMCYGRNMASGALVELGEPVGIIAAQAIGEPGTQLTMRTFHAGGVAGGVDITQGLPRVEELFEARNPKGESPIAEIDGTVSIWQEEKIKKIRITAVDFEQKSYDLDSDTEVLVENNQKVKNGDALFKLSARKQIKSPISGIIKLTKKSLKVIATDKDFRDYIVPANSRFRVEEGQLVAKGTQMIEGSVNLKNLLAVSGREAVQKYLVDEVQKIYRSQGVTTNDKHIEIIVRRMLSRERVVESGNADLLPGDIVNRFKIERINQIMLEKNKTPATSKPVILGITKASLSSGSFLAAASFQETIRVLTKAAISGMEDRLVGLKENLIIGKLIPAGPYSRQDLSVKTVSLPK